MQIQFWSRKKYYFCQCSCKLSTATDGKTTQNGPNPVKEQVAVEFLGPFSEDSTISKGHEFCVKSIRTGEVFISLKNKLDDTPEPKSENSSIIQRLNVSEPNEDIRGVINFRPEH